MSEAAVPLAGGRATPYLRALRAGLHALAPNEDHVPLAESDAHLAALDPALGGEVLAPAEYEPASGLPTFAWMSRAVGEQAVARGGASDARTDWSRAARLDPALAQRMQSRERLHGHLRSCALLPMSRLRAALRRRGEHWDYALAYDRMLPGGGWLRLRAELSGPAHWSDGLLHHRPDGSVVVDPGFQHLLARHAVTPIVALQAHLAESLTVTVPRLSRGLIGPFWFPGMDLPSHAPDAARGALVLHASLEVLGEEIQQSVHRDPWVPPRVGEVLPRGCGVFRERRFAASPGAVAPLTEWAASRGAGIEVRPLVPRAG